MNRQQSTLLPRPSGPRGDLQRGQALVPVIFIVMILTVLAVAFATSAQQEIRAADNFNAQIQRFFAARGAVNYAMSALAQTSNNGATYGVVPPGPDTDTNGWQQIGDAWVKIEVTDTASGININSASLTVLQRIPLFQQNPDLAAAIVDWHTSGDQPSENGAKSDYYETLTSPYDSKNAPFDTVNELLLVKGITPTLLYGNASGNPITSEGSSTGGPGGLSGAGGYGGSRQASRPGQTSPSTPSNGSSNSTPSPTNGPSNASGGTASTAGDTNWDDIYSSSTVPLVNMFTTVSRERNIAADGTPRVNINTASLDDLQNKLGLTPAQARRIIDFRSGGIGSGRPSGATGISPLGNNSGLQPGPPTNGAGQGSGGGNRPAGMQLQGGGVLGGNSGRPGGMRVQGGGVMGRPGGTSGASSSAGGLGSRQAAPRPGSSAGSASASSGLSALPQGGANSALSALQGAQGNTGANQNASSALQAASGGSTSTQGTAPVFKSLAELTFVPTFNVPSNIQPIADKVGFDDQPYRNNVININTAPAEVLAAVPGMDHTMLNAILNYRQSGQAFQTIGDLFTLQGIQLAELQNVLPSLSTKSSLYIVHIKVRTAGQQGVYAASALVELTDNGPRVLQWHEVPRTPGWSSWTPLPTLPTPTGSSGNAATSGGTG